MTAQHSLVMTEENARRARFGLKTQTRRILGPRSVDFVPIDRSAERLVIEQVQRPPFELEVPLRPGHGAPVAPHLWSPIRVYRDGLQIGRIEPKVDAGDTILIREPYHVHAKWDDKAPRDIPADEPVIYRSAHVEDLPAWAGRYRHARFMPRKFGELQGRIVSVWFERLHDIRLQHIVAEGIQPVKDDTADGTVVRLMWRDLWDSLHDGPSVWECNPVVVVYEFEIDRLGPPEHVECGAIEPAVATGALQKGGG